MREYKTFHNMIMFDPSTDMSGDSGSINIKSAQLTINNSIQQTSSKIKELFSNSCVSLKNISTIVESPDSALSKVLLNYSEMIKSISNQLLVAYSDLQNDFDSYVSKTTSNESTAESDISDIVREIAALNDSISNMPK